MGVREVMAVLRFVAGYWSRRPFLGASIALCMAGSVMVDVTAPIFVGRLVDILSQGGTQDDALGALGALALLWVGHLVLRDLSLRQYMPFAAYMMRSMVPEVFARVQRFSTEWHASHFAGATVRRISRGMWAYDALADSILLGLFPGLLVVLGASMVVGARWPVMGLYMGAALFAYLFLSVALAVRYVAPLNELANEEDSRIGAVMADAITSNPVVKAFAAEDREYRLLDRVSVGWERVSVACWTRMQNTFSAQMVVTLIMRGGLLVMAIEEWASGGATPGDVVFVITSYLVADGYLMDIGSHIRHAQRGINELQDMAEFAALPFEVTDRPGAQKLAVRAGEIRFEGVSFRYANQGHAIYDSLSVHIRAGEKVALVGPTGSGKSTFVRLLQRLYDLDAGEILIDGQDVAQVTQDSLRRAISVVPQDPALFHRSLAENIAYACPEASSAEIARVAARADAAGFIEALPDGYATMVGERGVKLSGGERQRVALARAFLAGAPILVLDEATSSLDSVTESAIQEAVAEVTRGRTTIVIAHRLSTVRMVDRILVFDAGRVVEEGSHDELLARSGSLYRRLYEEQAGGLGVAPASSGVGAA